MVDRTKLATLAKGVTRFDTDGREDCDGGAIEWQSMSPTTFATYHRKSDRDWYRDAPDVVITLLEELERVEASSICDACAGTGEPVSGLPCMCDGSGLASDAVTHLRSALLASERKNQELRTRVAELEAMRPSEDERDAIMHCTMLDDRRTRSDRDAISKVAAFLSRLESKR